MKTTAVRSADWWPAAPGARRSGLSGSLLGDADFSQGPADAGVPARPRGAVSEVLPIDRRWDLTADRTQATLFHRQTMGACDAEPDSA